MNQMTYISCLERVSSDLNEFSKCTVDEIHPISDCQDGTPTINIKTSGIIFQTPPLHFLLKTGSNGAYFMPHLYFSDFSDIFES